MNEPDIPQSMIGFEKGRSILDLDGLVVGRVLENQAYGLFLVRIVVCVVPKVSMSV